jgi:hypothetical protein
MNLTTAQLGILRRMADNNTPILVYVSRNAVNCMFPQGRHRLHVETVAALEQAKYIESAHHNPEHWQWRYEITEEGRNAIRDN